MGTDAKPEIPGFEPRELTHLGAQIRYLAGGSGPPVVLVHGLGGAASNWRLIAPELAREHRVLVPELPGHGRSGPLGGVTSLDPFAEIVFAVLEREEALPAAWVGHSLGGLVAVRAAVLRPEAVTGVVLAAAAGISSATRIGRVTVTVMGVARPGRLFAARRHRVANSRAGRTLAFGWWGVADPAGLDPEMAEAFLAGPAEHTDTLTAGKALVSVGPARGPPPRDLPVPLSLGRVRQLGAAAGRDRVRTPAARAAAHDRRLRPPPHRRAPRRGPASDARVPLDPYY